MKAPCKFDPANWQRLRGPERRALLDAEAVPDRLGVSPGSTVADAGFKVTDCGLANASNHYLLAS